MAHECSRDGLPCFGLSACYVHLKAKALNGGRDNLTSEELDFVGVGSRIRETSGGWRQPKELSALSALEPDADPAIAAARLELLRMLVARDLPRHPHGAGPPASPS